MGKPAILLWMSLFLSGCSAGSPGEPNGAGDPASQAGATVVKQPAAALEDGKTKALLEMVPDSQIAGPGEKPPHGLPLIIQVDVPEVPEHIRKPSGPAK